MTDLAMFILQLAVAFAAVVVWPTFWGCCHAIRACPGMQRYSRSSSRRTRSRRSTSFRTSFQSSATSMEVILLPLAIVGVVRLIDPAIMAEHRATASEIAERPTSRMGAALVKSHTSEVRTTSLGVDQVGLAVTKNTHGRKTLGLI